MPLSTSSQGKQLSDQNSAGTYLGASSTDLIGFYENSGGVVRPSGAAQAALSRGVSVGSVATFGTSQSLTSAGANTTILGTLTGYIGAVTGTGMTWQVATTDFVMVNKPTSQAGLGVGWAKVSGTNSVSVSLSNWTAATVTPTAGQNYGIVAIRGLTTLTATLTPAAVSAGTTAEQLFTVTGARVGEVVAVQKNALQATLEIVGARVAANNQIGVTFGNTSTTTPITPTAGETYTFFQTGGIDAINNVVNIGANIGAGGGPTGTAVSALNVTVTGIATSDGLMSLTKPTLQAGAALLPSFISGANAVGFVYWENAATVTPTTGEVYNMTIWRPNPAAPCVVLSSTLTPGGVPANTTAEQTFTVTGAVAGSVVVVNKPSVTPGVGIVGARVSGTNVICINYCNATAATITPASETYLVANFQQAIPDAGSAWIFSASQQETQMALLDNAMRTALTSTGFIAGA